MRREVYVYLSVVVGSLLQAEELAAEAVQTELEAIGIDGEEGLEGEEVVADRFKVHTTQQCVLCNVLLMYREQLPSKKTCDNGRGYFVFCSGGPNMSCRIHFSNYA